jgi:predicted glycosyltransferase
MPAIGSGKRHKLAWGRGAVRLIVYSHDSFGLGNIRRMLAICEHLLLSMHGVSILIISGSPMLHSFRVSPGIDYIKLPCLRRTEQGDLGVRFLDLDLAEVVRLRREIILSTVRSFRPDVMLVDKMPDGLAGELKPTLRCLKSRLPEAKLLLVLRDILDSSRKTTKTWRERHYYQIVQSYFDAVLVLGDPALFDVRTEYHFPAGLRDMVRFCGYLAKREPSRPRAEVRRQLAVAPDENLVLVTTGGGEDGCQLLENYLHGLEAPAVRRRIKSLLVTGPDLSSAKTERVCRLAQTQPGVQVLDFTDDMLSYTNAADVVVSMAGYNTICEILTLNKRAVVVPRVHPVEEQRIRAERMSQLSLFKMILPCDLNPRVLMNAVTEQIDGLRAGSTGPPFIDLGALPRVTGILSELMGRKTLTAGAALESAWAV